MDENKIIEFNKHISVDKDINTYVSNKSSSFQTNPILKKMLIFNVLDKKNKFSFKDLFW